MAKCCKQGDDLVITLEEDEVKEFWAEVSLYPCLTRIKSEVGSRIVRIPKEQARMVLDSPGYPRPLFDELVAAL